MHDFYANNLADKDYASPMLKESESLTPEAISKWAKLEFTNPGTGDKVALASVKWFLDYFAHFLSD